MAGRRKATAISADVSLPMPKYIKHIFLDGLDKNMIHEFTNKIYKIARKYYSKVFSNWLNPLVASLLDFSIFRIMKLHCVTLGENPSFDVGVGRF